MKKTKILAFLLSAAMLLSCAFPQQEPVLAAETATESEVKPETDAPEIPEEDFAGNDGSEEVIEVKEDTGSTRTAWLEGSLVSDVSDIFVGQKYEGTLSAENTERYYWLTVETSGRLTLSANASGISRLQYSIYDVDEERVWNKSASWSSSTQLINTKEEIDLTKGTYYFAVKGDGREGEFSFDFSLVNADESFEEINGGTDNDRGYANPVNFDTTYRGQLAKNDNTDFYAFTLNSSGRVAVNVSAEIRSVYFYLYDVAGNELLKQFCTWDNATKSLTADLETDLTSGTYYFSPKATSYTGNYSFSLSFTDAGESFPETRGGTNNTLSSASTILPDTTYKGQLAANDAKDFYKFTLAEAREVTFEAATSIPWIYYHVYNSSGREVWKQGLLKDKTTGQSRLTKKLSLPKGTCYFVADQYSNYTGNYSFKVHVHPKAHVHHYQARTKRATTKKNGSITRICSCGQVLSKTTIYRPKKMTLSKTAYVYDGKAKKPSVKITDSRGKTIKSSNYKVIYPSGRKRVGKYKVTVRFKGKYKGTMSKTFRITATMSPDSHVYNYQTRTKQATTKKNGSIITVCPYGHIISKTTIYRPKKMTLSKTVYVYNGKTKKPSVKITDSKGKTIRSSNYTVIYPNGRRRPGKYKVTVKFKGNYKGTMSKTFRITAKK